MRRSIVHIGYHKTATSWFQKRYYPLVQNATYVDRPQAKQAFLNTSAFRFDPQHAREVLGASEPVIVCEENLCGYYENAGFHGCLSKDMAYRIQRTLPEARVVIFIRSQPEMIAATYLQYVRRGGTASVKQFLFPYQHRYKRFNRKRFKKPMFLFDHFDYLNLIRHYQNVFGATNVRVYPYEAFARNACEFIADYGRCLDIKVDFDRIDFQPRNRSYRSATLPVARYLNRFARGDAAYRSPWFNVIPKKFREISMEGVNRLPLQGEKLTPEKLLGPSVIGHIHKQFADSNRILATELDLALDEYGYPMA